MAVALPLRNHFHVDSLFDCAGDEHPVQTAVREVRESEPLAGGGQCAMRGFHREQMLIMFFARAELLHERAQLGINRNREPSVRFVSINDDLSCVECRHGRG